MIREIKVELVTTAQGLEKHVCCANQIWVLLHHMSESVLPKTNEGTGGCAEIWVPSSAGFEFLVLSIFRCQFT